MILERAIGKRPQVDRILVAKISGEAGSRRRRCRRGSAGAGGAGRRSTPGRRWRSAGGRRCRPGPSRGARRAGEPDHAGRGSGEGAGAGQHRGGPAGGRGEGERHRPGVPHRRVGELEPRVHRAQDPAASGRRSRDWRGGPWMTSRPASRPGRSPRCGPPGARTGSTHRGVTGRRSTGCDGSDGEHVRAVLRHEPGRVARQRSRGIRPYRSHHQGRTTARRRNRDNGRRVVERSAQQRPRSLPEGAARGPAGHRELRRGAGLPETGVWSS